MANLSIPFLERAYLAEQVDEFLRQHGMWEMVPVDIERIVEFGLDMHIVPVLGLKSTFDIDAFVSSDLRSITVDEYMQTTVENRYRFSLAHEVGHCILHKDLLTQHPITCIEEYRAWLSGIDTFAYSRLEWQANCFAGLALVPSAVLRKRFQAMRQWLAEQGVSLNGSQDVVMYYVTRRLGDEFHVSQEVIEIRLTDEGLNKDVA